MLFMLLIASLPEIPPLRQFEDWIVGCDNRRACEAVALLSPKGVTNAPLRIDRAPEAEAAPTVRFPFDRYEPCTLFHIFVDGKQQPISFGSNCPPKPGVPAPPAPPAPAYRDDGPNPHARGANPALPGIVSGNILEYRRKDGSVAGRVSLKGVGAALRYIDDQQSRAGTKTAIVAVGSAPATTIPEPPRLPVVRRARPTTGAVPAALDAKNAARLRKRNRCSPTLDPLTHPPESYRLDDRTSLILLKCWEGPHNETSLVLTSRRKDGSDAQPAQFDINLSAGESSGPRIPPDNPIWNPQTVRLESHFRGECGSAHQWAWDGIRFRLVKYEAMSGEIASSDNCGLKWITLWRAAVE